MIVLSIFIFSSTNNCFSIAASWNDRRREEEGGGGRRRGGGRHVYSK